jgi:hypothetical protein
MLVSLDKKIIVLLPPKTASTSITNTLLKCGIRFDVPKKILDYPTFHLKLSEICERHQLDNITDYNVIQFTRNPYYRFVSAYYQLIRLTSFNKNLAFYGMNFKEFTNHLNHSKLSENFIKTFFGDDSYYYENLKQKKNWSGVRMFEEQVSYNDLNNQINYFKIEDSLSNMSLVSNLFGVDIIPVTNVNKNPINVDYDNLLDEECIKIIHRHFINDFNILGYSS